MDYRGNDNWDAWSDDSDRARARRRQEREFRERTEQAREAERERLEPHRPHPAHHQARRPSQGTWYENERDPSARRRPDEQPPRWQQQPRPRRSVLLQHERYAAEGNRYAQQQPRPRPPQRPAQLNRGYGGGYASERALSSRDIGIRVAIVAVLLVVFLVRIATFGGCARSGELDTQISEQQTQLQQLTDANAQAQAQLDAMQSSIDSYDQLLSSSSSNS